MDNLEADLFAFLCHKYVQRADDRQKAMGLQYTEAETHDLAKRIAKFMTAREHTQQRADITWKPPECSDA